MSALEYVGAYLVTLMIALPLVFVLSEEIFILCSEKMTFRLFVANAICYALLLWCSPALILFALVNILFNSIRRK